MVRKYGKFLIGLAIGAFFLWLAFRSIALDEVWEAMGAMTWAWVLPYVFVTVLAHYCRAVRWQLLLDPKDYEIMPTRKTLFNGVMLGYMVNYAIPRLGELSRAIYVTNESGGSNSKTLGTVFLERLVDFLILLVLLFLIVAYVVTDNSAIRSIFGEDTITLFQILFTPLNILLVSLFLVLGVVLVWAINRTLHEHANSESLFMVAYQRGKEIVLLFSDGVLSLRRVRNWPLFILATLVIWVGYILLAYIPFYGFDLIQNYGLGFREAFVIMVVSAIGVTLPSPGGVGTYHWFVGQTLIVVYMVTPAISMSYAIVTHGIMFLAVVSITLVSLFLTKKTSPIVSFSALLQNKK